MADFNVSTLSQRVDQSSTEILVAAVAGANTLQSPMVYVEEGIPGGSKKLVYIGTPTLEFQQGACVSTPSGGTEITAVEIGTTTFTHYDEFCGQNLSAKYPQLKRAGATAEIDMPQIIIDQYVKLMQNAISLATWRGNYNGYTSDLSIDGWLKQIHAASASTYSVNGVGGATLLPYAFSASNAVATVNTLASFRPAALYNEPIEFHMDPTAFEALKLGYIAANSFFNDPTGDPFRMPLHGIVNAVAVADFGLAGSKAIVALAPNTVAFGCDLLSDNDNIATDYDKKHNVTWMRMTLSIGAKIVKPAEIGMVRWA